MGLLLKLYKLSSMKLTSVESADILSGTGDLDLDLELDLERDLLLASLS